MSFLYLQHRTLKEVAETEELAEANRNGTLKRGQWRRLDVLLLKKEVNNPPDPEPKGAA